MKWTHLGDLLVKILDFSIRYVVYLLIRSDYQSRRKLDKAKCIDLYTNITHGDNMAWSNNWNALLMAWCPIDDSLISCKGTGIKKANATIKYAQTVPSTRS